MVKLPMESEGHTQIAVNVPLFLKKLWKMVNDKEAEDIIGWNSTGDGFVIYDQLQFITKLLPKYFKHNNMASFIRQLNFYDFHKVAGIDKDEIHFSHNCFLRDLPETLIFIKRKCTSMKSKLANHVKEEELSELLNGVKDLKTKHALVENELKLLKQENAALWSEINNLRVKHSKQTKIINKIIHFLISYMHSQNSLSKRNGVVTRKNNQKNLKTGPTILEIDYHNHHVDVPKQTKPNSYIVQEPSTTVDYDIETQNVYNNKATVNNPMTSVLDTTTNQDTESLLKNWVQANTVGSLNVNTLGDINDTSDNAGDVEAENSLTTMINASNDTLDNLKASTFGSSKDNMVENTVASIVGIPRSRGPENSIATTLNSKNNLATTKALGNPNDNFGLYFSNNGATSVPFKNPIKYNKILQNPKENLGLYLHSIQTELNSLQDMLGNLNSAEMANFCNIMEAIEPEVEQDNLDVSTVIPKVSNLTDHVIKNGQTGITENNETGISKDILADDFTISPMVSDLNEINANNNIESDQYSQDNIPEVLVDQYFNTDF